MTNPYDFLGDLLGSSNGGILGPRHAHLFKPYAELEPYQQAFWIAHEARSLTDRLRRLREDEAA